MLFFVVGDYIYKCCSTLKGGFLNFDAPYNFMVHVVRINGEIFGVPSGHLKVILSDLSKYEKSEGFDYKSMISDIAKERIQEPDFPISEQFKDCYLDFDEMEKRGEKEPVSVGDYAKFFGPIF